MTRALIIVFVLFLTAAAVASAGGAGDSVAAADPYARAVPPGQSNSVVFMALSNPADADHALVAVESTVAEAAELHRHLHEDGMMKMRRVERIDLPAGDAVALSPGGLHIMLIGLKRQLEPGQSIDLTLFFEDGTRRQLDVPVRKVEPGPMARPHH